MAKQGEVRQGGEERIFVKDGLRSFRKTFRVAEVYWGAATGVVLLGIVGWVTWKGAHPDPALFDMSAALESGKGAAGEPARPADGEAHRAGSRLGAPRTGPGAAVPREGAASREGAVSREGDGPPEGAATPGAAPAADRGPLPRDLAQGGYREGKLGAYTADTMYVKIDGRAGYFQAFGVKTLHTLTLEGPSETAPTSVDIEVYDLAESRNAIGAYNGERAPSAESTVADGSTFHVDRNAAFLARGPYYVRFIGSDESPAVLAEVRRLLDVFRRELTGEALPWGFSLFVDQLALAPSAVTYVKSNAFSFGFARDVYKATLSAANSQEELEVFIVALANAAAAKATAAQYTEGFASLGKPGGQVSKGVKWIEDEFLATFSGATAVERWTIGVRGAPSPARGAAELERLRAAVAALPADVRARAVPSVEADAPAGDYGAAPGAPAAPSSGAPSSGAPSSGAPSTGENEAPVSGGAVKTGVGSGQPAEESSHEY